MSVVQTIAPEPSFLQGTRFLPAELWAAGWTSPPSTHARSITLEILAETVYETAAGHTEAQLSVAGDDLDSLVLAFEAVILDCISSGGFTQLLLSNRIFQMWVFILLLAKSILLTISSNHSDGRMQTLGPGLE